MASKGRPASGSITPEQALANEACRFGFYQALRRLECAHAEKPRLGQSRRPVDDAVRLTQEASLAFAPSELASFTAGENGSAPQLAVYFFGLFGPNGPLPLHLTELARDRLRNSDDPTFSRFADVFHHRMLSLFYRAWANTQPTIHYDRPAQDRFGFYTGALFGLGMPSLRDRDAMPDLAKLHYAGRLADQRRNAEGLVAMIEDFFKVPAALEQFVGEWLELPDDCRCRLGLTPITGTLGVSATIGEYTWACQQKFRVIVGPLSYVEYERMLPGGDSQCRLRAMVLNYVGDALSWDVNIVLKKEDVPPTRLGQNGCLGWTTWLGSRTADNDAADLILNPQQSSL